MQWLWFLFGGVSALLGIFLVYTVIHMTRISDATSSTNEYIIECATFSKLSQALDFAEAYGYLPDLKITEYQAARKNYYYVSFGDYDTLDSAKVDLQKYTPNLNKVAACITKRNPNGRILR